MRKEILLDVVQGEVNLMQFIVAMITIPKQPIFEVEMIPTALNDKSDGFFMPNRGMGSIGRVQVHIAWTQGKCFFYSRFLYMDLNGPFELIEQLFGFIVMVILSGVGSGHDHNDVVARLSVEIPVAYRGLKFIPVGLNPFLNGGRICMAKAF